MILYDRRSGGAKNYRVLHIVHGTRMQHVKLQALARALALGKRMQTLVTATFSPQLRRQVHFVLRFSWDKPLGVSVLHMGASEF